MIKIKYNQIYFIRIYIKKFKKKFLISIRKFPVNFIIGFGFTIN